MQGLDIVYAAIDQVNDESGDDTPIVKSPDTKLLADGSSVDSLKLVNLIAAAEEIASDRFRSPVVLMNEEAFSADSLPFASVANLAAYIDERTA